MATSMPMWRMGQAVLVRTDGPVSHLAKGLREEQGHTTS